MQSTPSPSLPIYLTPATWNHPPPSRPNTQALSLVDLEAVFTVDASDDGSSHATERALMDLPPAAHVSLADHIEKHFVPPEFDIEKVCLKL